MCTATSLQSCVGGIWFQCSTKECQHDIFFRNETSQNFFHLMKKDSKLLRIGKLKLKAIMWLLTNSRRENIEKGWSQV